MWNEIWSGVPESEVPIGYVTNGVHFRSWVSFEMNQLYDRYLGSEMAGRARRRETLAARGVDSRTGIVENP